MTDGGVSVQLIMTTHLAASVTVLLFVGNAEIGTRLVEKIGAFVPRVHSSRGKTRPNNKHYERERLVMEYVTIM